MNGTPSSFHAGEREMQARAGETDIANRNIVVLSDNVIAGARPFIAKQFMVVLASVDAAGQPWSSLVFGKTGFLHTADGDTIGIDLAEQERDTSDPLWSNLGPQAELGMLFIELGSRRRYRVNGTLRSLGPDGIAVQVREAYPNCPKYIQRRQLRQLGEPSLPVQTARGATLRGPVADIVRQADTLFIASCHNGNGADASHRGGPPGFIEIVNDTTLRVPDYMGNSLFNTLGNLCVDPRAGLCIPDFLGGQLLQLAGSVTVHWEQPDPANQTGGTGRYWEFSITQWILRDTPQPVQWEYLDASPFNPG